MNLSDARTRPWLEEPEAKWLLRFRGLLYHLSNEPIAVEEGSGEVAFYLTLTGISISLLHKVVSEVCV